MLELGVDPRAEVVGIRYLGSNTLLRTRIKGRTQRYIACYDAGSRFKYYREITSSERKRVVLDNLDDNPIGALDWALIGDKWICQLSGKRLTPIVPNRLKAPTDYSVYMWGSDIVSNNKLKDMIKRLCK
jgi:hypothetical protein